MSQNPPLHGGFPSPPPTGMEPPGPQAIHHDPEFHAMRRAYGSFGTVAVLLAAGGFLSYVLLSSFAPDLMNLRLVGHLTVGLTLGLAQFVVMGVAAWRYTRHMSKRIDPTVRRLRAQQRQREQQQTRVPAGRRFRTW
ncbi:hypothetical protein GCM10023083_85370 [Streptomyces phyllanthi]